MKILLGPAGSPAASTLEGLHAVKELGLHAMEVEFTHGIKMSLQLAKKIGEENKNGIALSVHAPYFINLSSDEKKKVFASKKRILDSCERGHFMNVNKYNPIPIVFHPGYYGKKSKKDTYDIIHNEIDEMMKTVKENKWNVVLAPETTGKHSAFGNLEELISIVKKVKCNICIDPAHLFARGNGHIDYVEMFNKLKVLHLKHMHFHFSGITYTNKGERAHVNLNGKPDFVAFAKEILKRNLDCTIISESPITWKDSLKMKKIFEKLGYKF